MNSELIVLELLSQRRSQNRLEHARRQKKQQQAESAQQQHSGTMLGFNADRNMAMIGLDNGGVVPCEMTTSKYLKPGQRVIATIPDGASQGFVDGMA